MRPLRANLLVFTLAFACTREGAKPPPPAQPPPKAAVEKPAAPDRTRSLVTVLCSGLEGPGFFSSPDRVVARSRIACDQPRVRLHDGRTLLAKVTLRQKELDIAELEVAGGEGEPVPFAPGLEVKETDDVSVPGCCQGTVRSVLRTRLGVPHFEVAFDRVPPYGSVVLDAAGNAVGLTSDATLVLPIDALGPSASWAKLEERSKPAAAAEVAALRRALMKPGLVTVLADKSGKVAAILVSRVMVTEVKLGGCTVKPQWERFRMNAWFDSIGHELFQFIDKHDLDIGLFMTTVEVPCAVGAELKLEGSDPVLQQASVGKTEQAISPTQAAPSAPPPALPEKAPERPPAQGLTAADERMWRSRYRALNDERERFEADLRAKQRFIDDADAETRRRAIRHVGMVVLTPEERERYDQYKRDLEQAEEQRAAFHRKEDDLEREASNASVPREWRR